jgi:hypothetical protein
MDASFYGFFFTVVAQLAGVVAVEVSGGPKIPFHPGREVRSQLCTPFLGVYQGLRL